MHFTDTNDEVAMQNSRFLNNDRGAVEYRNVGEIGPRVAVEQCLVENNGYFLYGNISTSMQAVELHLHNTMVWACRVTVAYAHVTLVPAVPRKCRQAQPRRSSH